MQNEDKKQTKKIDWKKKGLGWIPDYPDLRDYQLDHKDIQKDGRLKREGNTNAIENLSENLIEIIQALQIYLKQENQPNKQQTGEPVLENIINEVANQVFGGISFVNVRIHRLLREQIQEHKNFCTSINKQRRNGFSSQIFELKNYLIILVLQGYLKLPIKGKPIQNQCFFRNLKLDIFNLELDKFDLFDNPKPEEIVRWLRKEEFDPTIKFLVIQFQQGSGISVDGIVGLETYTTLNEYFGDSDKLENLKTCIEQPQQKPPETTSSEIPSSSPKTKLVSIPSLIPSTLFGVILDELKSSAAERLQKELQDNHPSKLIKKVENKIFEVEFLHEIGMEEDDCIFAALMKEHFKKIDPTTIPSFLDHILKAYKLSTPEAFSKIFCNEFFVVEPIVSFVVKLMSPLAQNRNLPLNYVVEEALKKAHQFFNQAFHQNDQSSNSIPSAEASVTNTIAAPVPMRDLAKEALQGVAMSFANGIKLIIQNKSSSYITELMNSRDEEDQEIVSTLCFYFLVKKFLNQFIEPEEQYKIINARQPNIFDKQELFELKKLPDWQPTESVSKPNKDKNQPELLELFTTPELQIPVTNSLINSFLSRDLPKSGSPKPYLFIPSVVDLSYWDSAVEDQGTLQSCTAFAAISLIEYFANKSRGQSADLSPLFLYKAARNLMSLDSDVGASVRETMKAMALFGVPPEQYWTYEEDKVDEEPPSFCYSYAQNFQALKYFRLDHADMPTEVLLAQIKAVLAAGFPCIFGFTVYTSAYEKVNIDQGYIPFPSVEKDRVVGGHAVVAMGYDDLQNISCAYRAGISHGAFLIRNSWGTDWGKKGYGWIPYDYVLQGLTRDWWSLLKSEWFDEDSYGLGARNIGDDHPQPGQGE